MAGRGAYDTTIEQEMQKYRAGSSSPRNNPQLARDEAVRRMNVRRDKREGRSAWNRESTAYTPEDAPRKGKTSGGGKADTSHKGPTSPKKKAAPSGPKNVPIPQERPAQDDPDVLTGIPLAPGYRDPRYPNDPMGVEPDGGGGGSPGGGGPQDQPPSLPPSADTPPPNPLTSPIDPSSLPPALLPLLVAAGVTSQVGRSAMKAYPPEQDIANSMRQRLEPPTIDLQANPPQDYRRPTINQPAPPEQLRLTDADAPYSPRAPAAAAPQAQLTHNPGIEVPLGDIMPPRASVTSGPKVKVRPPRTKTKIKL